jgi:uncharacterized protein (DUF2236 family)
MSPQGPPLYLPPVLQRRLDAAAARFMQPTGRPVIDFSHPAGEPALVGSDSVCWQVFRNPVSLFMGGIAAVVLELAEPRVRSGVWEHTSFRERPVERLQGTGVAALAGVFAPRSASRAMIAGVRRLHGRVTGVTPDGVPYRAEDPELLRWVHATASFGFVEAFERYVAPLGAADRDRFFAEGTAIAALYGVEDAPTSQRAMDACFAAMAPGLEPSPIIGEFLRIIGDAPLLPRALSPVQRSLVRAAVALVPPELASRLTLPPQWRPRPWDRKVATTAARCAQRLIFLEGPAVQACRRLGRPDDHLHRHRA